MKYPEEFPHAITPCMKLEIVGLHDLSNFETDIANIIEPNLDKKAWEARPYKLTDTIRPGNYNPNLGPIAVNFMLEPFARLQHAQKKDSGVKFNNGKGKRMNTRRNLIGDLDPYRLDDLVGFSIMAAASSQGKSLGLVRANAWYGPLSDDEDNRAAAAGEVILRAITLPIYDEPAFKAHYDASKQRGHSVRQGGGGKTFKSSRLDSHN